MVRGSLCTKSQLQALRKLRVWGISEYVSSKQNNSSTTGLQEGFPNTSPCFLFICYGKKSIESRSTDEQHTQKYKIHYPIDYPLVLYKLDGGIQSYGGPSGPADRRGHIMNGGYSAPRGGGPTIHLKHPFHHAPYMGHELIS